MMDHQLLVVVLASVAVSLTGIVREVLSWVSCLLFVRWATQVIGAGGATVTAQDMAALVAAWQARRPSMPTTKRKASKRGRAKGEVSDE